MIVEKALDKAPAERNQSTRDLVVDLRRLAWQTGEASATAVEVPFLDLRPRPSWKTAALAGLVIVAVVLAARVLLWRRPGLEAPRQVVQFDIPPPPGTIFAPPVGRQPFAISPDGRRLAFIATGTNGTNIWTRDLASPEMRPVAGTERAWSLFWSPDSRSIYFSVRGTLM